MTAIAIPPCRHPSLLRAVATTALWLALPIGAAGAAERAWTAGDGAWSNPSNWNAVPGAGDSVRFAPDKPLTITLDADATLAGLSFAGDAKVSVRGTRTLTLADGGTIAKLRAEKPANDRIDVPLHLAGAATFSNDGKWVRLANQLIVEGSLSGNGTLTIVGKGDGGVALRADNAKSFQGEIVLQSGVLVVGHAGALGDTAHGTRLAGGMILFEGGANSPEPISITGKAAWDSLGKIELSGPIALEPGAVWSLNDDNGNGLTLSGAIAGAPDATLAITTGNITFAGAAPNTFAGTSRLSSNARDQRHNIIYLAKPAGMPAIAGPLELHKQAVIAWNADDQIADIAPLRLDGGTLQPNGHRERLGVLTLSGRAEIDFAGGGELRFADSSGALWKPGSQLLIRNWEGQRLVLGDGAAGLTAAQVAMIGFRDPAGKLPGLYRAALPSDGALQPGIEPVVPVNPPFAVTAAADAERAKLYEVDGLGQLTGPQTALRKDTVISFFGDSITWQNGYVSRIDKALQSSPATRELKIVLHNHGINGGGALQILEGSPKDAYGTGRQGPFAEVIAADKTDIAVLFIGINDVWWRKTAPEDFRKQLTQIAAAARLRGARLVIATMAAQGERPDGSNPNDKKIEQFVQITREVAAAAGAPLVDLRQAYVAYNQNHNRELQLDGSFRSRESGLLTTDGVHPSSRGNELLANLIARGIQQAAAAR